MKTKKCGRVYFLTDILFDAMLQEENSHRREQEQRRLQEAQELVSKKSSYYFGEEPELTNGAGEEVTPTEERGE